MIKALSGGKDEMPSGEYSVDELNMLDCITEEDD